MNTHARIENITFIIFLIICTAALAWILAPFFGAIFWACAIAIIFSPLQNFLYAKLGDHRNSITAITLLTCCIVVVIPIVTLTSLALEESQNLIEKIKQEEIQPKEYIEKIQSSFPMVQTALERINLDPNDLTENAQALSKNFGATLAKHSFSVGQSTVNFFINLGIMLYIAFFLIRDGQSILEKLLDALPLGDEREALLFTKFAEVVRATVKGNIVVAAVQGGIGGLTFWLLDIRGAALWMFVMAIAAMIPVVGAALVWAPVAMYLFATGNHTDGIILSFVGVAIIGLIDNILRPLLVGRDTKLPDYIVLLSTLGGIALFGMNGFVIGPIIAALCFVCWTIFINDFQNTQATDT